MAGRVTHFEVPADDQDRARNFYSSAFGWDITSMPEVDYNMVVTTPTDEQGIPSEPGAINGGIFGRYGELKGPIITIDVDDIDAALEKIGSLGGSTVEPKAPVMDMGFYAYFRDSEGNLMGLWENPPSGG
ncbi:VOC family protein [Arthrobacter pigmenti]